jgi:sugar lactone lactonase YvrE
MIRSSSKIGCISPAGDICGEGAVWHPEEKALYWTDINRFLIHRFVPEEEATVTWIFDEPVTSMNLTTDPKRLLVVFASRVGLWSPHTHPHVETLFSLPTAPEMRCNDAGVDPRGSLWVGTMRNNVGLHGENLDVAFTNGVLYRIDPNGTATEWKRNIGISNTVAWSPDHKTFYFGDSIANNISSFDFDHETGAISGEQPFIAGYELGAPDGSTIDGEGFLWNTRPGAGALIRVAPDGRVDQIVHLPTSHPTTCTFGGRDLRTLYITSARSVDQLSGSLFGVEMETGGLPANRFLLD